MTNQPRIPRQLPIASPVIVGGVGGSGTRVIAAILDEVGIYMGSYRNIALDSGFIAKMVLDHPHLWKFTTADLSFRLKMFTRLHLGKILYPQDVIRLYAMLSEPRHRELALLLRRAYLDFPQEIMYREWGFKHPWTHFFHRQLSQYFPESRYVHVIRHGLDMAFSKNTSQVMIWGEYLGCRWKDDAITPSVMLDFWIRVNTWVLEQCKLHFPERHYVLRFDDLCATPQQEIKKLLDFLNPEVPANIAELSSLVQTPESAGRYKNHISIFTTEQIQAVRDFGFDVENA